jgi:hypothetical protein
MQLTSEYSGAALRSFILGLSGSEAIVEKLLAITPAGRLVVAGTFGGHGYLAEFAL